MDGASPPVEVFLVTSAFLDGCRLIALEGDLDAAEAPTLEVALEACTNGFPVIVDLSKLSFIDSSGLHVLLRGRDVGRPAALVRLPGSNVGRVLDIVDAEKSIPVYDDVSEAVERLHDRSGGGSE
jgi:anti-anti-sigma factor